MNIFVGRLTHAITDLHLELLFGHFGQVDKARIVTDRVTGESRTPGPTPHRTFDLPITPATIDDNFLAAVLPTLDWAVGDTLVLEVMSTGQGTVTPMALTVERGDTIEVDGRAVPVWVGTMTGGPLPVQYVVSRDRPRRVHRIAPIGSPLAFERVAG